MIINEDTAGNIQVSLYDSSSALTVPSTLEYRIDDWETDASVKAATTLTPASVFLVPLNPADNAIIDSELALEKKIVTITADKGMSTEYNEQIEYFVRNLSYI